MNADTTPTKEENIGKGKISQGRAFQPPIEQAGAGPLVENDRRLLSQRAGPQNLGNRYIDFIQRSRG